MRRVVAKRLRKQAIKEMGSGNTSTEIYYNLLKKQHGKPAPVKQKSKLSKRQKRIASYKNL